MTKKRFELKVNPQGQVDIIDWVESRQKDAICIFNDLGVLPFSSAPSLCNLLNQLNDENEQLKSTNMEYEDALGRLEEENMNLKLALCEELQDNGNACYIRIFDDLFGLNYDEWESKHEYPDWEEILKNKKELE